MKSSETIGIMAGLFELVQVYMLGEQMRAGFLFGGAAGVLWITYAITARSAFGLFVICPLALVLNVRGFILWGG